MALISLPAAPTAQQKAARKVAAFKARASALVAQAQSLLDDLAAEVAANGQPAVDAAFGADATKLATFITRTTTFVNNTKTLG